MSQAVYLRNQRIPMRQIKYVQSFIIIMMLIITFSFIYHFGVRVVPALGKSEFTVESLYMAINGQSFQSIQPKLLYKNLILSYIKICWSATMLVNSYSIRMLTQEIISIRMHCFTCFVRSLSQLQANCIPFRMVDKWSRLLTHHTARASNLRRDLIQSYIPLFLIVRGIISQHFKV